MTPGERQNRAEEILKLLAQECGFELKAVMQVEFHDNGSMLQTKAVIQLTPIQDWQPPVVPFLEKEAPQMEG